MRSNHVYLAYIRESIERVQLGTSEGETLFHSDPRTQDAVLRRMETLADTAAHLSNHLKARHPQIPWRQISDFRNVLTHGYTEIRLDQVWRAIVHPGDKTLDAGPCKSWRYRSGERAVTLSHHHLAQTPPDRSPGS